MQLRRLARLQVDLELWSLDECHVRRHGTSRCRVGPPDRCLAPTVEEKKDEQRWAAGIHVAAGTLRGVRADGPA